MNDTPRDALAPLYPAADSIGDAILEAFRRGHETLDPATRRRIGLDVLRLGFTGVALKFWYRNYRGEVAERRIVPIRLYFGSTDYHPDPQWLLEAYDVERQAPRDFAVRDITFGTPGFQLRVQDWMQACFGPEIAADSMERNHRFFEEATELVQANRMTRSEAHQLVDYVFDRPVGEFKQETGGVMVTLAALCETKQIDMMEAGEVELARVWTKIDRIREKQAAKPRHSPLPTDVRAAGDGIPIEIVEVRNTTSGWPGQPPHSCIGGCATTADCKRRPACDDPPGAL